MEDQTNSKIVELPSIQDPGLLTQDQPWFQPLQYLLTNGAMAPQINAQVGIQNNTIFAQKLQVGQQTWNHNLTFTPTDYRTMSWSSGTLFMSSGQTYAISAGNTGALAGTVWIYFDAQNGPTALNTTSTYSSAIGDYKIILAMVSPVLGDTSAKCVITAFNSAGTTIDGSNITTGKIQSTDGRTYFDLNGRNIVINDGSTNRVLMGFQLNGF